MTNSEQCRLSVFQQITLVTLQYLHRLALLVRGILQTHHSRMGVRWHSSRPVEYRRGLFERGYRSRGAGTRPLPSAAKAIPCPSFPVPFGSGKTRWSPRHSSSRPKPYPTRKVLDLEGNLIDADKFDQLTGHENLKKFTNYKIPKPGQWTILAQHQAVRRLELASITSPAQIRATCAFIPRAD